MTLLRISQGEFSLPFLICPSLMFGLQGVFQRSFKARSPPLFVRLQSQLTSQQDILDPDRFWDEELLRATKDRLFGCSFNDLDSTRSGVTGAQVQGLVGSHAYSVLRAVEVKGKRFLVIRNPWGKSEWTGRWSDGSKEWTREWLEAMPLLGHVFGDDGQFVMECELQPLSGSLMDKLTER